MSCRNNFLLAAAAVALFAPAMTPSVSQAADLSGSYGFSRMVAGFPGTNESMVLAGSGSITFNTDGSCSARFDETEFAQNLVTGEVTRSSGSQERACNYTAASSGDLTLTFPDVGISYRGSVSADGSSIKLAGSESDTPDKVQMLLAHKSGSGMTAATLNGSYPVAWTAAGFPGAAESSVVTGTGDIIFDGAGGCSANLPEWKFSLNRSTKIVTMSLLSLNVDYECGYSISSQGAAAVTLSREGETFTYHGTVDADGSSFALGGASTGSANSAILMTGNKVRAGMSQSDLVGTYGIARIMLGFPSGTQSSALAGWGAITFDGNGNCSSSFIDTAYSKLLPSGAVTDNSKAANLTCSYSVDPEQGVSLSFGNGAATYSGHISADSSSFIVSGGEQATGNVMLVTGERLEVRYPAADMIGTWASAGLKTPVSNTSDPNNFGYDVNRMMLHIDGSGANESLSTSDPLRVQELLPSGAITINDDAALSDTTRNEYFYMNAGKNVMFQFRKDLDAGAQQFFLNLKQAANYSAADVAGTWLGAGIKTPAMLNSDPGNFGYEVGRMVLSADGSGGNWLRASSSPFSQSTTAPNELFAAGYFGILTDGRTTSSDPDHHFAINAAKDVMVRLRVVNGQQQFFVNVKQGSNYKMEDLAGNWVGAGMGTPKKGETSGNFGYEVRKLALKSDGSVSYTVSSSEPFAVGNQYVPETFKIASDGTITTDSNIGYFFMNASKDVLVQFREDSTWYHQHQLFVYLKEAPAPVYPVNGSCGAAHGASSVSAPATNLCSSGAASALTGTGPWSWSCNGENGGTTASCSTKEDASTWTLTVAVTGNGTVNGSSSSPGSQSISCSNDSASGCSASYKAGESVQLTATPGAGSLFASWSGGISGTGTPVSVVMDGAKAVTATFSLVPKVMVGSQGFATLQAAYDDANTADGSVIKLLEGSLPGSFTAGRNIAVRIEGGYNETFASRTSSTSLPSPFKVKAGQVRVQGVNIKP